MNRDDMRHVESEYHLQGLPCSDLFVLPDDEIDTDYTYGNRINCLFFEKRNWYGLALSLMIHSAILFTFWILPKPVVLKTQTILTVTLVGSGEQSEDPAQGGGGSITNSQTLAEPVQTASASDRERSIAPQEIPERLIPPTKTAPLPDRKPLHDKPKKRFQNPNQFTLSDSSNIEAEKAKPSNSIDREGEGGQDSVTQGDAGGNGRGDGSTGAVGMGRAGGNGSKGPLDMRFGSVDGPRFLKKALPVYPGVARRVGKEGQVVLQLTIDEHGGLIDIQLVKKAGFGFDEEAMKAVRQSTFCPAQKDGKPILCKVILPVKFVLKNGDDF
jgi:protein TonB